MDSQQKREAKLASEMLQAIDAYAEVSYSEDRQGILCAIVDLAGHSREMDVLYRENKALRARLRKKIQAAPDDQLRIYLEDFGFNPFPGRSARDELFTYLKMAESRINMLELQLKAAIKKYGEE